MLGVGLKVTDLRCQRCGGPISFGAVAWVIMGISALVGLAVGFWTTQRVMSGAWSAGEALLAVGGVMGFGLIVGAAGWTTLWCHPRR